MLTAEQRMHDVLVGKLAQMELDHDVEIIFAVESGSRAWGFPSPDSDYDVRFVYRQRPQQYARLLKQPDTLGRPAKGALYDITGWDVGKAIKLGLSSNATLLEWLNSPIRYRWTTEADELKTLIGRTADRRGLTYNYFNLARAFHEKFGEGDQVELKKYFYGLRPALALRHLRMFPGVPPMNIAQLMEAADLESRTERQINELRHEKASCRELGTGSRRDAIDVLIAEELTLASDLKLERTQMVSDAKLLEMAERTFLKLIGLEGTAFAAGAAPA